MVFRMLDGVLGMGLWRAGVIETELRRAPKQHVAYIAKEYARLAAHRASFGLLSFSLDIFM